MKTERNFLPTESKGKPEMKYKSFYRFLSILPLMLFTACTSVLPQPSDSEMPTKEPLPDSSAPTETTPSADRPLTFQVNGTDISAFSIVYPDEYEEACRRDMQWLADTIAAAYGVSCPVGAASDMPLGEHEIVIGTARDNTYSGDHVLDCRFAVSGGNLYIGGIDHYADIRGVYYLVREVMGIPIGETAAQRVSLTDSEIILKWKTPSVYTLAWCTHSEPFNTEQMVSDAVEAGFNLIDLPEMGGQELHDMLNWCAYYGAEVMFYDWNILYQYDRTDYLSISDDLTTYLTAPMCYGNYFVDEPSVATYDDIARGMQNYEQITGNHAFVNLFPEYATKEQLGCDSYEEYITSYLDTVNPELLCVDIYSLQRRDTTDAFVGNLARISRILHQEEYRDVTLGVFIQAERYDDSMRAPTAEDLSWQTYVGLSFGAKMINYFTYMPTGKWPALLDHDGSKTEAWEGAKAVNNAVLAFADEYVTYEQLGVRAYNCDSSISWVRLYEEYDFSSVLEIESDAPLLLGCFGREDGGNAFIVTNQRKFTGAAGADDNAVFSIRTVGGKSVRIWIDGVPTDFAPDENGLITLTLGRGEGVFGIILQ